MTADGNGSPDRPRAEWGDPQALGSHAESGTVWTLDSRAGTCGTHKLEGLFLRATTGRGGGGGGSGGLGTMQCRMAALDPGIVAAYGPLPNSIEAERVTVELSNGYAKAGVVLPGPDNLEFDFFVAVLNRRPTRLVVTSAGTVESFVISDLDIKARGFEFEADG